MSLLTTSPKNNLITWALDMLMRVLIKIQVFVKFAKHWKIFVFDFSHCLVFLVQILHKYTANIFSVIEDFQKGN